MKKIRGCSLIVFLTLIVFSYSALSESRMPRPWLSSIHKTASNVQLFSDFSVVRGGRSYLLREDNEISMHLHTLNLPKNTAVTIWWVIFNNPGKCTHPEGQYRCGPDDLQIFGGSLMINSSVLYATGEVIGPNGMGDFSATLMKRNKNGALFGPGLLNPHTADIHLVVRTHGPLIPGLVKEMISTFGAGCNNVPAGTGTQGPNNCTDIQFSVHEA